jgi:S-adenosylmethionine decarboxylase
MSLQFFEGPEKKVEVVVDGRFGSLRGVPKMRWYGVVEAAGAAVLSEISSAECDAYLLSESSLFVFDDHITMITCGQTRLVEAVVALLDFVPADDVALLMYERKNENFPEHQPTSFAEDATRLSQHFAGTAYRFGDEHSHCVHLFHTKRPCRPDSDDTTLEILMHGLDADRAALFGPPHRDGEVARRLGLDRILPGFAIDEYLFEPTG